MGSVLGSKLPFPFPFELFLHVPDETPRRRCCTAAVLVVMVCDSGDTSDATRPN